MMDIESSGLIPGNFYEREEFCIYRRRVESAIAKAKQPLSIRAIHSAIGEAKCRREWTMDALETSLKVVRIEGALIDRWVAADHSSAAVPVPGEGLGSREANPEWLFPGKEAEKRRAEFERSRALSRSLQARTLKPAGKVGLNQIQGKRHVR